MTGPMNPDSLKVDPSTAFFGSASVVDGNTVAAVKAAYNQAASRFDKSRTAVLIEVLVRVAPKEIDFDSDAPLVGGVCDMSPGCESCQ